MDLNQLVPNRPSDRDSLLRRRQQSSCARCCSSFSHLSPQSKALTAISFVLLIALLVFIVLFVINQRADDADEVSAPAEADVEASFMSFVSADNLERNLLLLVNRSHIAGSKGNFDTAAMVFNAMNAALPGLVQYEDLTVLLSYPLERHLSMTSPYEWTASLEEAVYNDGTSDVADIPTFNAYSANGSLSEVAVVYVNYCQREDFLKLTALHISVAGYVVLCRYGQIYRGDKVSNAAEKGAVGVLIYSDPIDDGYVRGTPYIDGPWRPSSGVQRGSVWNGNGDPSTPGYPSTDYALRLNNTQLYNGDETLHAPLPQIISLPISWSDAQHLLSNLTGEEVPDGWAGGLPFEYHIGVAANMSDVIPVTVNLTVTMNQTYAKIRNVVARIPGSVEPDRIIMLGNHRDAWVFGAADPSSGTTVLMEVARSLGQVMSTTSWRPRRSIHLCSWDAEEYALIGSSEFAELHETLLMQRLIAYINVDTAVSGTDFLHIAGAPSFSQLAYDSAARVPAPLGGSKTLYDLWKVDPAFPTLSNKNFPILDASGLGDGSDFAPFLQRLGVSSMNVYFSDIHEAYSGVYHSNFDSFYWMKTFGDPTFEWHAAAAKLWGVLALKLANPTLLSLQISPYAALINDQLNQINANGAFSKNANADIVAAFLALTNSIETFAKVASQFDVIVANILLSLSADSSSVSAYKLRALNDAMSFFERAFLYLGGLPLREYYRHTLWVPAMFDGYASGGFALITDCVSIGEDQCTLFAFTLCTQGVDRAIEIIQNSM